MLKLRTFIILIIIYIIAFVSVKYRLNLFYPYDLFKNYVLLPVIAVSSNQDIEMNDDYNETIIKELKDEIKELKEITGIKTVLADYQQINSTVIERNRNYWFNSITIDKGSDDGVSLNMAVVDKNGLIGKVSHVSKNMSEVKLITTTDVNNKTSVVINSDDEKVYGIIEQYNDGYLEVTLTTKNISIEKDLTVSTTGMGGIYPSGILIGKTIGIKKTKYDVGLIVLVKPIGDFQNLKYVSVLKRN